VGLAPCPDSFDVAAKVHEIANALRALECANVSIGSTVVVTAATGAMGAATVKLVEHLEGVREPSPVRACAPRPPMERPLPTTCAGKYLVPADG
jgi:hypothetical protein